MCSKKFLFLSAAILFCSLVLPILLITVHTLVPMKYLIDHGMCLFQRRVSVLAGNMRTYSSSDFLPIFLALVFPLELAYCSKIYAGRVDAGLKGQGVVLVKSGGERGMVGVTGRRYSVREWRCGGVGKD